jgi:hypothetical protein
MHTVGPISRAEIDAWPVEEAGLPIRVVNCMHSADVTTVGQMRPLSDAELLRIRSLGRISLNHIRSFFRLCDRVERGTMVFHSMQEVLDIFLERSEQFILAARYGLHRQPLEASRQCVTLQEIGNHLNRTRERVRQVEEGGQRQLASRLSTICLTPFAGFLADFIADMGGAVAAGEFAPLRQEAALAGLNPAGVGLLLSDLGHDRLTAYRGFFSTWPVDLVERLDAAARECVAACRTPVTVDRLLPELAAVLENAPAGRPDRILAVDLDHAGGVTASLDGRYFSSDHAREVFLLDLMAGLRRPVHYRAVTSEYNDRVKPSSRKGAGFILEALGSSDKVVRTDRGFYDLR